MFVWCCHHCCFLRFVCLGLAGRLGTPGAARKIVSNQLNRNPQSQLEPQITSSETCNLLTKLYQKHQFTKLGGIRYITLYYQVVVL